MNNQIIIIFVVLGLVSNVICNGPQKFPNIGYIGSTYDIFKGNPHSTKGLDPGFTLRNMFHYKYTNHTSADGIYSVPDGVNAVGSSACSFSFSSEVSQSSSSYKNSLEVDVNADFSGWGASFSASTDYKTVHEGSSSSQMRYVTSQAKCESYSATVQKAALNPALDAAITRLPVNSADRTPYIDFYDHWGTHFAHSLRMGGRYGVRSAFSASDFTKMSSSDLDISVSAGYSGLTSINVNAATDIQKQQASEFESHRKDFQIYQVGGKPPLNESMSTYEWAQSVKLNPLPLTYNLIPITNIMTEQNFPDDPDIESKRQNLVDSVVSYCQELGLQDETLCNSVGSRPDGEIIKIHFAKSTRYSECAHGQGKMKFVVPVVDNPNYYIFGTMMDAGGNKTSYIVAENSSLLADPTEWKNWCNKTLCALRPVCPTGFSSISDIVCCGSNIDTCLTSVPRTKPCIADQCLSECGWYDASIEFLANRVYMTTFGNPQFGHPTVYESPGFVRYKSSSSDAYDRKLIKCLRFNCLEYTL